MVLSRSVFLTVLFCLFVLPFYISNFIWLTQTTVTTGKAVFEGREYSGQIGHSYTVICFTVNKDTLFFNSNDNVFLEAGTAVVVRYHNNNHKDARIDTFAGVWAGTIIFSLMPILIIFVISLDNTLIPYHARIKIGGRDLINIIN